MCPCGSFEVLPHSSVYNYIKERPKLVVVTTPLASSTCVPVVLLKYSHTVQHILKSALDVFGCYYKTTSNFDMCHCGSFEVHPHSTVSV